MPLDDAQTALVQRAQTANRNLKEDLVEHAAKLQAELLSLDELISTAESIGDQALLEDADDRLVIFVDGAKPAPQYIHPSEFDDADSPLYDDAQRKHEYVTYTTPRLLSPREKDELALSVRNANMRVHALRAQSRGENPFDAVNNMEDLSFFDRNVEDIDWDAVAADFNAAVYPIAPRSARDCEVFWRDGFRPNINRSEWTLEEVERLDELVKASKEDPPDWEDVAEQLGTGRVALDCLRRFHFPPVEKAIKNKNRGTWSKEDDARLEEAIKKYGSKDWQLVSLAMNGDYTGSQCESHWRNVRTTLKRGPWTAEEDASLHRAVQLYSAATETIPWKKVAPLIPGRTNVQCRDRWLVVSGIRRGLAKPKKNPPWKDDEDATLREAIGDQWNKKKPDVDWLEVAQSVGRKDRNCRGRWTKLRKLDRLKRAPAGKDEEDEAEEEEAEASDESEDDESVASSSSADVMQVDTPVSEPAPTPSTTRPQTRKRIDTTRRKAAQRSADAPSQAGPSAQLVDAMDVDVHPIASGSALTDPAMEAAAGTLLALGQAAAARQSRALPATPQATASKGKQRAFPQRRRSLGELLGQDDGEGSTKTPAPAPDSAVASPAASIPQHRWSKDEDERLLQAVAESTKQQIWTDVAAKLPGRSIPSCKSRYRSLQSQGLVTESARRRGRPADAPQAPGTAREADSSTPTPNDALAQGDAEQSTSTSTVTRPTPSVAAPRRTSSRSTRHQGNMAELAPDTDEPATPDAGTRKQSGSLLGKRWTDDQDERLLVLVTQQDGAGVDWKVVAVGMSGRTAAGCSARYGFLKSKTAR